MSKAEWSTAAIDVRARAGAARRRGRAPGAAGGGEQDVLFADDLLPGVGDERMTLRQGVAIGGVFTFVMLVLLQTVDELETATLPVLAPNIRDSFGVSDGVIVFISAASGAFLVLGALPMGWLADRFRRGPIIGWAAAVFAAMVFSAAWRSTPSRCSCPASGWAWPSRTPSRCRAR